MQLNLRCATTVKRTRRRVRHKLFRSSEFACVHIQNGAWRPSSLNTSHTDVMLILRNYHQDARTSERGNGGGNEPKGTVARWKRAFMVYGFICSKRQRRGADALSEPTHHDTQYMINMLLSCDCPRFIPNRAQQGAFIERWQKTTRFGFRLS